MGLLEDKVAIVTGAGRGIGRSEALALAEAGASVVVNDLGSALTGGAGDVMVADAVVREIEQAGGKAVASYADVATSEGAQQLVWTALNKFGRLDVLVNNAGIIRDRTLMNMSEEEWDAVQNVHLKGTFLVSRNAAREMKMQGEGGAIINTTSISGLIGAFGHPNYSSAKAGIFGFTRGIADELGRYGIRVNALCPHAYTRMTAVSEWMQDKQEVYTTRALQQAVVFLASDRASKISGRVIGAIGGKDGSRILEMKMTMSDGYVMGPEDVTAENIADNLDRILSPLPDITAGEFLTPPKSGK
ncbi:MAG: SDR family NAD(P)-dependent oxidoreductase [Proteobacteria bacterium]|nr:SDR family NAD(P)-dependent oxidoreductase [Pseudomonadota bacterium]